MSCFPEFSDLADSVLHGVFGAVGFELTERQRCLVTYAKEGVAISAGCYLGEVGVFISKVGFGQVSAVGLLVEEQPLLADELPDGYFALHSDDAKVTLRKVVDLMCRHLQPLLAGDQAAWAEAILLQEAVSQRYALDTQLAIAREGAAVAWRSRNYAAVVSHLTPVEDRLRKGELARLAYCRNQLLASR